MIKFTQHALIKLEQRRIKKEFILKVLSKPDYVKQSHGGRMTAFKKFGKLYLKVVFREEGSNSIIITQHWAEKINL